VGRQRAPHSFSPPVTVWCRHPCGGLARPSSSPLSKPSLPGVLAVRVFGAYHGWMKFLVGCCCAWLLACSTAPRTADVADAKSGESKSSRGCVVAGPEVCFNARDDNCNGPIDEGCGLQSGLVQFVVAWDQAAADVDLEVIDPQGSLIEVGRAAPSGLIKDRDCPGNDSACRGRNIENVYLGAGHEPTRGTYVVKVRLERWDELERPVVVQLGVRLGPRSYWADLKLRRERQQQRFEWVL